MKADWPSLRPLPIGDIWPPFYGVCIHGRWDRTVIEDEVGTANVGTWTIKSNSNSIDLAKNICNADAEDTRKCKEITWQPLPRTITCISTDFTNVDMWPVKFGHDTHTILFRLGAAIFQHLDHEFKEVARLATNTKLKLKLTTHWFIRELQNGEQRLRIWTMWVLHCSPS
ncbi:unnamed protein product [Dicrocoelium dendriticum]|nr:unnamed protein product [Dicrocoelium dendriticum]